MTSPTRRRRPAVALLSAAAVVAALATAGVTGDATAGPGLGTHAAARHAATSHLADHRGGSVDATSAAVASVQVAPMARSRFAAARGPLSPQRCRRYFGIRCYQPGQLQAAYGEKKLLAAGTDGTGTTIAIVDSYGSPTIGHDLKVFDAKEHLPAPPSLRVIAPAGRIPRYHPNDNRAGWAGETTLDVEYAHTIAPGAALLLVETPTAENEGTSGFPDIVRAETYVVDHGLADVISQSFGATEETFPTAESLQRLRTAYVDAQRHNVTVLAASGDTGAADVDTHGRYYSQPVTSWPPSDPLVTAVGGTRLTLSPSGHRQAPDQVWNDTRSKAVSTYFGTASPDPDAGGGGRSRIFARPSYQSSVAGRVGRHRGVPDVSMSAACSAEVETYSSFGGAPRGWSLTCGTSEATPLFAGVVALADQVAGHDLGLINPALYTMSRHHSPGIVDVTRGTTTVAYRRHGHTDTVTGSSARAGYDLASGVGTVDIARFVTALASASG